MYISDKDHLFYSKLEDGISLCYTRQKPYFFSLMSERRQAMARDFLENQYFSSYSFWGGYNLAERKLLGLFFDDTFNNEMFPVSALEFKYRKCDELSHRDFLGALMSLGIERETVGDILVDNGRTVVFLKSEIKNYVVSQIFKIGNIGVTISDANILKLPAGNKTEELSFIVSSMRIDNIVAAICSLSREKTKALILSGNVSVNFLENKNVSFNLRSGDKIVIRGKGKYILNNILGTTKKGRIKISVVHFR